MLRSNRSSHQSCSVTKCVLRNFAKFTLFNRTHPGDCFASNYGILLVKSSSENHILSFFTEALKYISIPLLNILKNICKEIWLGKSCIPKYSVKTYEKCG